MLSWKTIILALMAIILLSFRLVAETILPIASVAAIIGGTAYINICFRRFGSGTPARALGALGVVGVITAGVLLKTGFGLLPALLIAIFAAALVCRFFGTTTSMPVRILVGVIAYLGIITLVWATPSGYREVPWGYYLFNLLVVWVWLIAFFHYETKPQADRKEFERELCDLGRTTRFGLRITQDNRFVKIWALYFGCAVIGAILYGVPTLYDGPELSLSDQLHKLKVAAIRLDAQAYERTYGEPPTWAPKAEEPPAPSPEVSGAEEWRRIFYATTITPINGDRPRYVRGWFPLALVVITGIGFLFSMIVGFSDDVFDSTIGAVSAWAVSRKHRRQGQAHVASATAAPPVAQHAHADHAHGPHDTHGAHSPADDEHPLRVEISPSIWSRLGTELTAEVFVEFLVEAIKAIRRTYARHAA